MRRKSKRAGGVAPERGPVEGWAALKGLGCSKRTRGRGRCPLNGDRWRGGGGFSSIFEEMDAIFAKIVRICMAIFRNFAKLFTIYINLFNTRTA